MAAARTASTAGDLDEAVAVYRRALGDAPELADLRLELANLLASRGERQEAVSVLEGDATEDRQVLMRLGELLAEGGERDRALAAYRRVLMRDPRDEEARQRADDLRAALELARMPEEYQRIATAPTITRADLAALLAVKVTALARLPVQTPPVAVDISGSWAREHILAVLAHDVLPVYPNHTFQPGATARRGDLARAVQRVLDLAGYPPGSAPALTDMSRSNLNYYAASRVVAAGLMDLTPEGAFHPWRPPSGEEATRVVESLARLIGP
jgi:tetratricopeptide (TPR) repeat protein